MGSCYVYITNAQNWTTAENKCKGHGGHLVTIDNAEENQFILLMVNGHSPRGIWIGLTDQDHEGHFIWSSGKIVFIL